MSITPSSSIIVPRIRRNSLLSMYKKGMRPDGRKLHEYRKIDVITNYIPKAEGSALVRLGDTVALAGVKIGIGTPYPDTPDEGILLVNAEFVPLASPSFEPGPPNENAIELARVIDRSLRELGVIDLSKLVLKAGEKVLEVWADIYVLDHGGNLIDASMLATMVALKTTKIPPVVYEGEKPILDRTKKGKDLPIKNSVVTVSMAKLGDYIIVDPDEEEEALSDLQLTIAVSEDGRIAGIQKMGMGFLTEKEIEASTELALEKARELHKIISESVPTKTRRKRSRKKNV